MDNNLIDGRLNLWRRDPVAFITQALVNPETGKPFVLNRAQRRFLEKAVTLNAEGRLQYPELVFSAPKKSGKTTFAAMLVLYVVLCLAGPYAEAYCLANDFEQAVGRVFEMIRRIVEASSLLRGSAKITANRIEFSGTGATITAIASDYASAAGANPTVVIFDELWAYTSERSQRLWDEMVPVPTRKISLRLTVTYAGFEGESELLESLYKRGIAGKPLGDDLYKADRMLMFWTHHPIAPWQDVAWLAQMRSQLGPNAYLRLIENRWVTSENQLCSAGLVGRVHRRHYDTDGGPAVTAGLGWCRCLS